MEDLASSVSNAAAVDAPPPTTSDSLAGGQLARDRALVRPRNQTLDTPWVGNKGFVRESCGILKSTS